jgi:hypothetical protein
MSLVYEFADKNKIEYKFNRTARLRGKNWEPAYCKRQNLMLCTPEKCNLGRAIGYKKSNVSDFIIIWPVYVLRKSFQLIARIFTSAYERVANMEMEVRAFKTIGFIHLTGMSSQMKTLHPQK